MHRKPLTQLAQARIAPHLADGGQAVDATAGKGLDTLFLARCVGPTGRVWAFDLQASALDTTRMRLEAAGCAPQVTLIHAGHQYLAAHLASSAATGLDVVMFNLGYLPGGDHEIVTRPETTLTALTAARALLAPTGLISLMVYRGHPGGEREYQAILDWLSEAPVLCERLDCETASDRSPVLFLLRPAR